MVKRTVRILVVALSVLGMMAGPALANNGQGKGAAPDRGNSLISASEPLEVTEVLAQQSDPTAANFDEEFTFYRVTYEEITHDGFVWREPTRTGPQNVEVTWEATTDRFWYGVTGPDEDGIQHEIVHTGTIWQYFETDDGWKHLKLQFNGNGELLKVNGVTPVTE